MRKVFLVGLIGALIAGLTLPGCLLAQVQMGKGLKAGINMANFTGDDAENMDSKIGFCGGGFLCFKFLPVFAIQPEALFTMKGAKAEVMNIESTTSLSYLEIPVLAKVSFLMPSFNPTLLAGPSLGIKLSAKAKTDDEEEDIEDIKSTDIGLAIGAGADIPMGVSTLTLEARYTLGMTTIDDSAMEADMSNSVISFLAGITF